MGIRLSISGADTIKFGEDNIVACTFTTESSDNANARSTDIANTLAVKGKIFSAIGGEVEDDSFKVAKWSEVKAENKDSYRKVTVEILSGNRVVRKIVFPNAFIVDYKEDYFDTEGAGTFELKVRQKKDKCDLITIEREAARA